MKTTTDKIKDFYNNKNTSIAIFKDSNIDKYEMKENAKKIKEEKSIRNIVDLSDIVDNIIK